MHQFHTSGSSKVHGVAIFTLKDLQFTVLDTLSDGEGGFLFVNCVINEAKYTLTTLYAPNNNQLSFLKQALCKLMDFKAGEILLGGDLNFVCDPALDRANIHISSEFQSMGSAAVNLRKVHHCIAGKSTHSKLGDIFDQFDLLDTWRALYPGACQYTYHSPSHDAYSCIDFILTSKARFNLEKSVDIGIRSISDHVWVSCLLLHQTPVQTGWNWSLNVSLLQDPVLCEQTEEEIKNYFEANKVGDTSNEIIWDAFKAVIRGHFLSVASTRKKVKAKIVSEIKANIAFLETKHIHFGGKKYLRKLELERKELTLYETSQAQRNLLF